MKIYCLALCCLLTACSLAIAPDQTPQQALNANCQLIGFTFKSKQLQLNSNPSAKQTVYLLHNTSTGTIVLNHQKFPDPGVSAGWASQLESAHFSAITLDQKRKDFELSCQTAWAKNKQVKSLDCQKVLQVCQLQNIGFGTAEKSSYWLTENKTATTIIAAIKKRGISINEEAHPKKG